MRFDENVGLDASQVEDRRGGRGGVPGAGLAVGGGGIGILVLVIAMLLGVNPMDMVSYGGATSGTDVSSPASSSLAQDCRVGADANSRQDCRIVGFVNSIQDYWTDEFAQRGSQYTPAK